jgi:FAD/FMN-containing dehydrogenase
LIKSIVNLPLDHPTRKLLLPISIRGGGHGYTCQATKKGGLMIDLRNLRSMTIRDHKCSSTTSANHHISHSLSFPTIEMGTGLQWKDVLSHLQKWQQETTCRYHMVHGQCTSVGIAGFALHGGVHFGAYSELYGLASDSIVGLTAILANSSIFQFMSFEEEEEVAIRSKDGNDDDEKRDTHEIKYACTMDSTPMIHSHCHDLVYAFRGAGSSFGIVTSITMRLFPQDHQLYHQTQTQPLERHAPQTATRSTSNIVQSALSIFSIRITDLDAAAQLLQAYMDRIPASVSLSFFGLDAYFKAYFFLLRFAKSKLSSLWNDPRSLLYDWAKESSTIHFIVEATWLENKTESGKWLMLEELNQLHVDFCSSMTNQQEERPTHQQDTKDETVALQSSCTEMTRIRPWLESIEPWSVSSYDIVWGTGHAYSGASTTVGRKYEYDVLVATFERYVNYTREKSCSDCVTVLHRVGEGIRREKRIAMANVPQSVHPFRFKSTLWVEIDCGLFHNRRKLWSQCSRWVDNVQRSLDTVVPNDYRFHYPNVPNKNTSSWSEQYYGAGYSKLQEIKSIYDPQNLLFHTQSISSSAGNDKSDAIYDVEQEQCVEIYDRAAFKMYRTIGITIGTMLITGIVLKARQK